MKRRTARRALAAAIAAAAAAGSTAFTVHSASAAETSATEPTCSLTTTLPIPEGLEYTAVSAMSDDGSVIAYYARPVDQSSDDLSTLPLLYADGEVTEVPMPGDNPRIQDVNSSGNGTGYSSQFGYVPYAWIDGELTELPFPGDDARARGINEHGDIVGDSWTSGEGETPLLWPADGSGPVELPLPDGADIGVAHDISDDGTVFGAVYYEDGPTSAYTWAADGTVAALPTPEGYELDDVFSIATDVNGDWASGQLFVPGAGTQNMGVRWNLAEGTAERVGLDYEVAVSADGTVAGYVGGWLTSAAIQAGDTITELPGLVAPEDRTMTEYAEEISADGTLIAGTVSAGEDADGNAIANAVLWTCE